MNDRIYYIQRLPTKDDLTPDTIDIEATFDGLYINDIDGILDKGEVKNRYVEEFADIEGAKVYEPEKPLYKETKVVVKLTTIDKGEQAYSKFIKAYVDFVDYITARPFILWDEMRKRKVELLLTEAIKPNDILISGQERIQVDISFRNLKGTFEKIE